MTTYTDKVTLLGPKPYGGTYNCVTTDPNIPRLIDRGYRIVRQWTVKMTDGKVSSLPLN